MKPKRIELPEPAAKLWKHATTLVEGVLQECKTLEHDRWYLGGGTALAAEWHHRESSDVDILIAPGLSMAVLDGQSDGIERLIAATNGERIEAPDQKLSVKYGKNAKVDIFSSGRQLPGHEEPAEIQGGTTLRLTNAQIFTGKLRRAIEGSVAARDLFDICHAARIKEPGIQQALNALTVPEYDQIREFWESSRAKIEEQAATRLSGIQPENWIKPEELLHITLRTTDDHRYAGMIIRAGSGYTTVRTVTIGGQSNEYRLKDGNIERGFQALGIARHLGCHNIRAGEVIRKTQEAMKESGERTVIEVRGGDGRNGQEEAIENAARGTREELGAKEQGQKSTRTAGRRAKQPAEAPPTASGAARESARQRRNRSGGDTPPR